MNEHKTPVVSDQEHPSPSNAKTESAQTKKEIAAKSRLREIIRFVVTGVICTVIDFVCQLAVLKIFEGNLTVLNSWSGYVSYGIAVTAGYLISSAANFVFSRRYVFQNVDKAIDTRNQKTFWIFVGIGVGGWLIGLGLQELGAWICGFWGIDISLDVTKVSLLTLFGEEGEAFWAFVAIFCIKTCVTLVYNYITRKTIIFKEPKSDTPAISK